MSLDPVALRKSSSDRLDRLSPYNTKAAKTSSHTRFPSDGLRKMSSFNRPQTFNSEKSNRHTKSPGFLGLQQQQRQQRTNLCNSRSINSLHENRSNGLVSSSYSKLQLDLSDPQSSKKKEKHVPSYLRGTASSILKAEHNITQGKINKSLSNKSLLISKSSQSQNQINGITKKTILTDPKETKSKPSIYDLQRNLGLRDNLPNNVATGTREVNNHNFRNARKISKDSNESKVHTGLSTLSHRKLTSSGFANKSMPVTPTSDVKTKNSKKSLDNCVSESMSVTDSLSSRDTDLIEAIKHEIPASFITLDESSLGSPEKVPNSSIPRSPKELICGIKHSKPKKSTSLCFQSSPKIDRVLKNQRSFSNDTARLSGLITETGKVKTPISAEENGGKVSVYKLSPSRLRPPSVTLRDKDTSFEDLDRENAISLHKTASTINLHANLLLSASAKNQIPKSSSLSGPLLTKPRHFSNSSSLRDSSVASELSHCTTSSSNLPSLRPKVSFNNGIRGNESFGKESNDDSVSFLKDYSFDMEMSPMFENLSLTNIKINESDEDEISEANDSVGLDFDLDKPFLKTGSKSSFLGKSRTTSNFGAVSDEVPRGKNVTELSKKLGISKSFTLKNFAVASKDKNNEKKSSIPANNDKRVIGTSNTSSRSLIKDKRQGRQSSLGERLLRPHIHYHHFRSHNTSSPRSPAANGSVAALSNSPAIKKSTTLHTVSSKSLMKAVKDKYINQKAVEKESTLTFKRAIRAKHSHGKADKKILSNSSLRSSLMGFHETKKLLQAWSNDSHKVSHYTPIAASDLIEKCSGIEKSSDSLNIYEKGELSRKSHVFYMKFSDATRVNLQISNFKQNFGYDDENKNYIAMVGDHIDYRYEILQILGNGSFGNVLKCWDHKEKKTVAVKIIKNDMQWSLQAVYEIKVLRSLSKVHLGNKELLNLELKMTENVSRSNQQNFVLSYIDHFNFRSHMCIVTELLSVNLFQAIQASKFNGFSINYLLKWSFQLINAVKYIHDNGIIHCDLKPENIMLISPDNFDIKIIDFGSACYKNETSYSYIQSRFYRAPEVLIGARYSTAIDVWSAGCILAEVFTGLPLFAGQNEKEQLAAMIEVLGLPGRRTICKLREELKAEGPIDKVKENQQPYTLIDLSFDKNGVLKPGSMGPHGKKRYTAGSRSLATAIAPLRTSTEKAFLSFVSLCLNWDPFDRVTAEDLLDHPFLKCYCENKEAIEISLQAEP